jgi:hypothetical protein
MKVDDSDFDLVIWGLTLILTLDLFLCGSIVLTCG